MSNVFAAFNGDDIGEQIGNHIANDDHESLSRVSDGVKSAHDMIERWVESKGGKVVVSSGDEAIVTVPKQALAELKSIQQKYSQLANATVTIGVGASMSEASKALIFGKMNDKNQIVHYDPSIDSQIAGDENEDKLPSPESVEQEEMESEQEESGLADDPEAAGIDDGNGDEDNNESELEDEEEVGFNHADDEEESGDEINNEDYHDYEEGEESDDDQTAEMPLDEAIDEHEGLVDTLRSPSHEDDLEEADEQEGELENYKDQAEKGDEFADDEFADENQEFDPSQPPHEQDMSDDENFAHDAEENEDDEQDADNIEADEEENVFGGNTEPEDEDFAEDAAEDAASQDLDSEMTDDSLMDDQEAVDMDDDGDVDEDDMVQEDDAMQELSDEDLAAQDEENQDDSVMTDMLHANIGDEESEDSDDEVKQDVIESLMSFKQNKEHLEELKQTNPEMYQANIMMLRAMIQMAKKLKMNPDASMEDVDNVQAANEQFPQAEDGMEQSDSQEALPNSEELNKKKFGKNEVMKSSRIDKDSSASARYNRRIKTPVAGFKQKGVHSDFEGKTHSTEKPIGGKGQSKAGSMLREKNKVSNIKEEHKKILNEQKQMPRPNLPKSEKQVENLGKKDRCWDGYEPTPGKKAYSQGSCKPIAKSIPPKSEKDSSKGIHKPYMSQGESMAGELARTGKDKPKTANKEVSRKMHSQKLAEQKAMPRPNLPKSEKDSVKGVHRATTSHKHDGVSNVGENLRNARGIASANPEKFKEVSNRMGSSSSQKEIADTSKEHARASHKQVLAEQKAMPRPNLPKSESDSVSSFKQGDRVLHNVHGAGTVAGSHGQGIHSVNFDSVADRNVKPTKVHEKNFQQKQRPVQKSEKPKVEQMNLDLKKKKKAVKK